MINNRSKIILSASVGVLVFALLYQVSKAVVFQAPKTSPPLIPPAAMANVTPKPILKSMNETMPLMSNDNNHNSTSKVTPKPITNTTVSPLVFNDSTIKTPVLKNNTNVVKNNTTNTVANTTKLPSVAHVCPDGSVADANASCVT